jgi:predicted neuraminidase
MVVRSGDQGRTWSRPQTLIDTPADDRHPSLLELPDGTLVCSLFTYTSGDPQDASRVYVVRASRFWLTHLSQLSNPEREE